MSAVARAVAGPATRRSPPALAPFAGALLVFFGLLLSSVAGVALAPSVGPVAAPHAVAAPRGPSLALGPEAAVPSGVAVTPSPVIPSDGLNTFRQLRIHALPAPAAPVRPESIGTLVGTDFLVNGTIGQGLLGSDNLAFPTAVAYDPTAGTIFVAGGYTSTIGQYDPSNASVVTFTQLPITWLAVPNIPAAQVTALVYDSQLDEVFAAAPLAGEIYGIGATSGAIVSQFSIGSTMSHYPSALAVDSVGQSLFVADALNNSVDKLSATSGSFLGNATVGGSPGALAYLATSGTVYAANSASNNVSIINAASMAATGAIPAGSDPRSLALIPATGALWTLNGLSGNVSVYTGSVLSSVSLPATSAGNATSLLYDPAVNTVYVLNAPAGHLAAFNASTRTAATSLDPGGLPYAAAYDPADKLIAFANLSSDELTEINGGTGQIAHLFHLGAAPVASVFSAATQLVYVIDPSTYWLTELDARTDAVIATVPLASPGYALAYASTAGLIAIVESDGTVQFFSTTSGTVVGAWTPGNQTLFANAAYGNGEFFFTGSAPGAPVSLQFDEVFIVSASGYVELADVIAGHFDDALVYDSTTRDVAVSTNTSILEISSVTDGLYATISFPFEFTSLNWTSITWDNVTNELYLGGFPGGNVAVVNLTNGTLDYELGLTGGFPPGYNPTTAMYLRQTNQVFFTDSHTGQTYAVTKNGPGSYSVAAQATGAGAAGLSYSTLSGLLYVAAPQAGTLTFLTIGPDNTEQMIATLSIAPRTVQLGSAVVLHAIATYPEWDDNFSYSGLPGSCPNANVTTITCTAGAANSFTVTVKARNPHGVSASASESFVVFAPLALLGFNVTPTQLTLGGSFRVQVTPSGGVAPLTVGYPTRPNGCAATSSINWTCTPTAAGNATLEVEVSDAAGHIVESNVSLVVNAHLSASLKLSTNNSLSGHAVVFTVSVTGGTAPFTYSYTGLPAGCTPANSSTISCSPSVVGVYPVVVQVSDADGATYTSTAQLVVSGSGGTSSNGGALSTTDLLLIVLVVVIVAVAVVGLALRRRGPSPAGAAAAPPPSAPPEEEEPPMAEYEPEAPVAEAPPPEPMAPTSPPSTPVVPMTAAPPNNPNAPAAGAIEEEPTAQYYQGSNVVANPAARGQRPALICPKCGTANEPWLTNCRKCKRALVTTGGA